jgi:Uncharacterized protein conserved in archaea
MQKNISPKPILGIIETVSFPELGIVEVMAKIDTGAYSGALHCEEIDEIVHPVSGKKALKIRPIDSTHDEVIIEKFARVYTTSSSGHRLQRYVIQTPIIVQEQEYMIRIGITKRDMMNMKVLIGRRFLRRNNMLVDVTVNQEFDNDGGRKL